MKMPSSSSFPIQSLAAEIASRSLNGNSQRYYRSWLSSSTPTISESSPLTSSSLVNEEHRTISLSDILTPHQNNQQQQQHSSSSQSLPSSSSSSSIINSYLMGSERSASPALTSSRRIRFADEVGQSLHEVREFTGTPDTPPASLTAAQVNNDDGECWCDLRLLTTDFDGSGGDQCWPWSTVVERVQRLNVSLASVYLGRRPIMDEDTQSSSPCHHCLTGTVAVKNVAFEKSVIVRCTFDGWSSSIDVPATFVRSERTAARRSCLSTKYRRQQQMSSTGHQMSAVDVFEFSVDIPLASVNSDVMESRDVELAVCYTASLSSSSSYWDNNDGKNYHLKLSRRTSISPAAVAVGEPRRGQRNSPAREYCRTDIEKIASRLLTEYASWRKVDLTSPYW